MLTLYQILVLSHSRSIRTRIDCHFSTTNTKTDQAKNV